MKKILSSLLAIGLTIGFSGCSSKPEESPVKIEVTEAYNKVHNFVYPKILITSLVDNVNVENVVINKGNCKYKNEDLTYINGRMTAIKLVPRKLEYGKQIEVRLRNCNVLKVEVETDQGSWSVEY